MPPVRSRDREALWKKLATPDVDKEDKDANSGHSTVNHAEVQPKLEDAVLKASTGADVKDAQSKDLTTTYGVAQSAAEVPPKLEGAVLKASTGSDVKDAQSKDSAGTTHAVTKSAAEVPPKLEGAIPDDSNGPDVKNAQSKDITIATNAVPQSAVGVPTTATTATPKSAADIPTTTVSPALQTAAATRPEPRADPRASLSKHPRTPGRQGNDPRSGRRVPLVNQSKGTHPYLSRPSPDHKPRNPKGAVLSGPDGDLRKATQASNAADSKGDAKGPGVHTITKQHECGGTIAPVLLDNTLPITKTLKEFKSGDPDPVVVTNLLERVQARTQKFANTQAAKKVNASNRVSKKRSPRKSSPRRPSLSPEANTEDVGSDEDTLDLFLENKLVDGKWWVQPIDGKAFPKRPEYSTWCKEGDECHGLKSYNCLMRHDYQADYWFKRKANLAALPVDPDGLGSKDPPCMRDDKPLRAPKPSYRFTGALRGAATGKHWALHRRRR